MLSVLKFIPDRRSSNKAWEDFTIERGKICTLISFKTPFIIKFRHEKVDNK